MLCGLEYAVVKEEEAKNADTRTASTKMKFLIEEERNKEIRNMRLKVIKNKDGATGDILLRYYPKFNYFEEVTPGHNTTTNKYENLFKSLKK